MINLLYVTFVFKKHIKSGAYVDYFFRILAKTSLLNFFVWGFLYVGEKFIIEYLTRFTNINFNTFLVKNNSINIFKLSISWLVFIIILTTFI